MKSTQELIDEAAESYARRNWSTKIESAYFEGAAFAKPLYVREGFELAYGILYAHGYGAIPQILKDEGIRLGILPKADDEGNNEEPRSGAI